MAGMGTKMEVFEEWTIADVWDANWLLDAQDYANWKGSR